MTTNTTKIETAAETILALDLGKYKSVACLYRSADDKQLIAAPWTPLASLCSRGKTDWAAPGACDLRSRD